MNRIISVLTVNRNTIDTQKERIGMKKTLLGKISNELLKKADAMCRTRCKYYKQYKIDQEKYDGENPTWFKHCQNCPMNEFFNI